MTEAVEPQVIVAPVWLMLSLLGPLYALVTAMLGLLFKHSTNKDRHFDKDACTESKALMRDYIEDVDSRAAKAVDDLKDDINKQFDRLFTELEKKK